MESHDDEACIIINHPFSYTVVCNIFDTDEARRDEELMDMVAQSEERGEYRITYAAQENNKEL